MALACRRQLRQRPAQNSWSHFAVAKATRFAPACLSSAAAVSMAVLVRMMEADYHLQQPGLVTGLANRRT